MKKTTLQKLAIIIIFVTVFFLFSACNNIQKTFIYKYNEATGNNTIETITLRSGKLQDVSLVIPTRENFVFDGWYLDWLHEIKVSDEFGNLVIGQKIFDSASERLYAKWTAVEEVRYKVLMVFVTETKATLTSTDGIEIEVDYTMTELEKTIFTMVPPMMTLYLNALLNGLVIFDIDIYFTTVPIGNESFHSGYNGDLKSYGIRANNIPELQQGGILDDYRSVITTFGMNDYDNLLHSVGGSAGAKYGYIHTESIFKGLLINNEPIENLLDSSHIDWKTVMSSYIHEFTHTVEQWNVVQNINYDIDFHDTLVHYGFLYHYGIIDYNEFTMNYNTNIETARLFLLRQSVVNGKSVGIPLWFWKNEIVVLKYIAENGGYFNITDSFGNYAWMERDGTLLIPLGSDIFFTVTAVAPPDWIFIGWSDGVSSATRTDLNRYSDLTVTAIFIPVVF